MSDPTPPAAHRLPRRHSLRARLSVVLGVGVTVPILAWAVVSTLRTQAAIKDDLRAHVQTVAARLCTATEQYVDKHLSAVTAMAGAAADLPMVPAAALDRHLAAFHGAYPGFLTLLAADRSGLPVSTWPERRPDGGLVRDALRSVSDRPYFQAPLRTGQPFVSEAFLGRGFGADPIVALSAPVMDEGGRLVGIVEGSLDLREFRTIGRQLSRVMTMGYLIVDRSGRVIYSNADPGPRALSSMAESAVMRSARASAAPVFEFVEPAVNEASADRRIGASCTTRNGWTLFATESMKPIDAERQRAAVAATAWAIIALIGGLVAAAWLARSVSGPLDGVADAVAAFQPNGAVPTLVTTGAEPREVAVLIDRFNGMARRVNEADRQAHAALDDSRRAYAEVARVLEEREVVIAERTGELARRTEALEAANATLAQLAATDALTGIANRRAWLEGLDRAGRAAVRDARPVTVLAVDVDHFKQYNDRYGHPAGDSCLQRVAQAVAGSARRPLDLAGRIGGEEFAVVIYGSPADAAVSLAERLRVAVERLAIPHAGSPVGHVTVSVGVATLEAWHEGAAAQLLDRADEALYEAKRTGRNRVVTWAVGADTLFATA